ncbi:MAG TPA: PQQ-binding-like beta-propeller repeat protein [Bryobacteraceae bacterium]|jgi:quinoprotein glucose dehydrogenase|nr:PQQ-binding-like beta-propeller repeat protein [Bryobacteraceae bacterium]
MRRRMFLAGLAVAAVALAQWKPKETEWPTYNADTMGSRYRPLDQINAKNFSQLEIAWRFKTDSIGNRPEYKLEGTPLMVNGVVYATAGSRRAAIALDAATGELLWVHGEHEGERGANAPRQLSGRGLAFWSDGHGDDRILYITPGFRLICLNAKTGMLIPSFGKGGVVDLKLDDDQEISAWNDKGEWVPDLIHGEIGIQSAPIVGGNTIIIGAAFREGMTPRSMRNNKGYVRGYDVRTGKRMWIFHTIPKKGEPGYETWENGSAEYTGNTGMWTQPAIDQELGLAYLPIESPTGDYYGGHRPGNDLYGESLVCVDLKTGQRKWYFQLVHHPLWDMDISSTPLLMDINVNGKAIKAVAQPTKQGFLYVFDRTNGKPVFGMEERPVEVGSVPGEWYSKTQPFPVKPPAYARNGVTEDELIDFTPELHARALEIVKKYHLGPVFTPPVVSKLDGPLATLTLGTASGGTNWPGASFDPETHTVYAYACNACLTPIGLVEAPKSISDMRYVSGIAGREVAIARGPGENAGADSPMPKREPARAGRGGGGGGGYQALNVDGLPLIKPPYGTLSAINVDRGDIVWQIAHGETPDNIRKYAEEHHLNLPRTGQSGYNIGTLVTKTLLIAGDGQVTNLPDRGRCAMLRAYDKATGKQVGEVCMPAPQSGSPMTYELNGKQYIIVAVSGGNYSGEYLAFTLPESEETTSSRTGSSREQR